MNTRLLKIKIKLVRITIKAIIILKKMNQIENLIFKEDKDCQALIKM